MRNSLREMEAASSQKDRYGNDDDDEDDDDDEFDDDFGSNTEDERSNQGSVKEGQPKVTEIEAAVVESAKVPESIEETYTSYLGDEAGKQIYYFKSPTKSDEDNCPVIPSRRSKSSDTVAFAERRARDHRMAVVNENQGTQAVHPLQIPKNNRRRSVQNHLPVQRRRCWKQCARLE